MPLGVEGWTFVSTEFNRCVNDRRKAPLPEVPEVEAPRLGADLLLGVLQPGLLQRLPLPRLLGAGLRPDQVDFIKQKGSRRMKVKVEDYHIRNAFPGDSTHCPIALATTPLLPAGQRSVVGRGFMSVWEGQRLLSTHDLPDSCVRFVDAFDKKQPVEPFEFEFDLTK